MNETFRGHYIITVANDNPNWRRATAPALVRQVGIPVTIAARWIAIRRQMSPAGLRRKVKAQRN